MSRSLRWSEEVLSRCVTFFKMSIYARSGRLGQPGDRTGRKRTDANCTLQTEPPFSLTTQASSEGLCVDLR